MSRESFPELPAMPETVARIPMKQLTAMIARTMFAISMEESRFTLNGALLLLGDKGLTMVATDGHRLAYTHSDTAAQGAYRSLVPRKAMTEITRLADGAADDAQAGFSGDDNHLFLFEFGARLLITRKLTGNFPDYDRVPARRTTQISRQFRKTRPKRRSNASHSLRTSDRKRSGFSSAPENSASLQLLSKPANLKRVYPPNIPARNWKSVSTRNTCSTSCGRFHRNRYRSP